MKLPRSVIPVGFTYTPEIVYPDGRIETGPPVCNLIPQDGIDFLMGMVRATTSPIANWYLFLYEGNYVPAADADSSILQTTIQESLAYDEATRPLWNNDYDGIGVADNAANRAIFTFNATKTIYGAGICSVAAKGSASGLLLSVARFSSPKITEPGAEFRLTGGLTLIPTNVL